ncbi:MAG: DNRLRE domain-containing protein [Pedobacter sp.]|uniref:DNRLRE domain-containing protein n=1 Tax=Pedobacter sp. TaxID=1411316 RepID=UPI00356517E5
MEINQAVQQVAIGATTQNKGIVILKETIRPYEFTNPIRLNKENVILKGETTITQADGNQKVTLRMSRDAPNLGFYPGFIAIETNNIEVRNLHFNGNVTPNYGFNGFWEGLNNYRGYEVIYVGIWRQTESANPLSVSNIIIEDISAYDTPSDTIYGTARNIVVRNIRNVHIGHSGIDIRGWSPNTNLLIENIYCHDILNACVRFRVIDGAIVRNIYSDYYGGEPLPKSATLPNGKPYYNQDGIELWQEYDTGKMQNVYVENVVVKNPSYQGIIVVQDPTIMTSIFRNLTFKNIYIDCTPTQWSTNPCNTESGSSDSLVGGADKAGAIRLQNVESVTFDDVTTIGRRYGIRAVNYMPTPSSITIKNSEINNALECGITTVRGNSNYIWHVDNNNFWNNKANVCGYVQLGTGNTYNNPGTPTPPPTVIPTYTVSPTISPTIQPTGSQTPIPTTGIFPIADTSIKSGQPSLNRGGIPWIDVGTLAGSGYGNYRGLLMFDILGTPANTTIKSATLRLKYEGDNRNTPTTVGVYRPSSSWNSASTWNSFTPAGGSWYDKNGVSFGTTPYSQVIHPLGSNADINLDVTALVQSYTDGTYPNTGFFLKANEIESSYLTFHSSEASESLRPLLIIEYNTGITPTQLNNDIYALIVLLSVLGIVYVNGMGNKKKRR